MDDTIRRRETAHLLAEARKKARQLTNLKDRGVLVYFIQMALIEVLAQHSDVMEKAGLLVSDENMLLAAKRLAVEDLENQSRSQDVWKWLRKWASAILGRVQRKPDRLDASTRMAMDADFSAHEERGSPHRDLRKDVDPLAELQKILKGDP